MRDSGFFRLVGDLLDEGYDILASGLAFDFRGEPFGFTPDLALLAEDRCMWMTVYCTKCGSRAAYPQRIINGSLAPYNSPQIQVGGDETYEPRCDEHFVLPGRARCPVTMKRNAACCRAGQYWHAAAFSGGFPLNTKPSQLSFLFNYLYTQTSGGHALFSISYKWGKESIPNRLPVRRQAWREGCRMYIRMSTSLARLAGHSS